MSETNKIIGIASQLAGGKDTIANYLVKKLNLESNEQLTYDWIIDKRVWKRVGFADAVKKVFMDCFDVDWDFIETWKRKDETPVGFNQNIRKSLQFIGDGFRQIQSDIWIKLAFKNKNNIILSDVRYVNEAKMIKEKGGTVVAVCRPGFENDDPNPSEAQIRPIVDWCVQNCEEGPIDHNYWINDMNYQRLNICFYDFFLKNEGSLEDLYAKVDNLLIPYLKGRGL